MNKVLKFRGKKTSVVGEKPLQVVLIDNGYFYYLKDGVYTVKNGILHSAKGKDFNLERDKEDKK